MRSGVRHELNTDKRRQLLSDVPWADSSTTGRLLVTMADGRLQIRDIDRTLSDVSWEYDLARMRPDPSPPPPDASRW